MSGEAERVRNEEVGRSFRPHPEERVSEGLRGYHKAEIARWRPIIEAANIKPE